MHRYAHSRHLRPALSALAVVAIFTGCSADENSPLSAMPGNQLELGVQVSDAEASAGSQIAVAVAATGQAVAGAQGYLRYDPARLSFVGQGPDGEFITIVNDAKAASGELRTISFVPGQMLPGRTGTLVFQVKAPDYTQSLRYELEMATDASANKEITRFKAVPTAEAADLVVPANAKRMGYEQIAEEQFPAVAAADKQAGLQLTPGQYLANLRYGNANLSAESPSSCTSVNILDAAYVANIAVGNNSALGVDFPTRDPVVAGNVRPATGGVHPGVNAAGLRTIDILDAAAVANEAVGNDQTIVCDFIPGRAPITGAVVTLTGNITANRTFFRDTLYRLDKVVKVNNGATLTIQSGTRIEGIFVDTAKANVSALIIERDGRIDAQGTQLQPITFSCNQTPKFKGCWGGMVINGNATVNSNQSATLTSPVVAGRSATAGCFEVLFEGSAGTPAESRFGGCNDADSSGVLRYAVIEYGGFAFAANRELNNLTVGGVGSKTVIEFVQAHGGLDDGYEIFGGTLNTRNIVLTANSDDAFDFASGWSGNAQFIVIQQDSLDGDKSFEIDNTETAALFNDLPRVNAQIYNVTMVGKADPAGTGGAVAANNVEDAINLRRGARPDFFNFVMMGYPALMDLDDDATCPAGTLSSEVKWQSITSFNFTRIDNADLEAVCAPYTAGTSMEDDFYNEAAFGNLVAATNPLIAPFNVMTPDWRPVSAAAVSQGASTVPPANGFFDVSANYRGAVGPLSSGGIPWTSGWTRSWANATTP
jgi:hypothetical protein